jgi:hypothetical protein
MLPSGGAGSPARAARPRRAARLLGARPLSLRMHAPATSSETKEQGG